MNDILIVEDHGYIAEYTKWLIDDAAPGHGFDMALTAGDALRMIEAERHRWRLILLDLEVPGAIGLSLAYEIKSAGLSHVTCVLTGSDSTTFSPQLCRDGFLGYIRKATPTAILLEMLLDALAGRSVFPPAEIPHPTRRPMLTMRQIEVLQLAADGSTSKEIAAQLNLTPGTVDNHIFAAMTELNARTRPEAVKQSLSLGFIKAH